MNRQRPPGGIGWTDWTFNPVRGCEGQHAWCYARAMCHRFKRSFRPSFHPDKLGEPERVSKPAKIFVCSTGDLWGPWVPPEWQRAVLEAAARAPWHTYQFLGHYPGPMRRRMQYCSEMLAKLPNRWVGMSAHQTGSVRHAMANLTFVTAPVRYLSVEPILGPVDLGDIHTRYLDWIIVGALTGHHRPPGYRPDEVGRWALDLAHQAARRGIPVYLKRNLATQRHLTEEAVMQWRQWPRAKAVHPNPAARGGDMSSHEGRPQIAQISQEDD